MSKNIMFRVDQHTLKEVATEPDELKINQYNAEMKNYRPKDGLSSFNCDRCYRLKKKCTRDLPCCRYCSKTKNECVYSRTREAIAMAKAKAKERTGEFKIVMEPKSFSQYSEEPEVLQAASILNSGGSGHSLTQHEPILQRIISEPSTEGTSHKLVSISSLLSNDDKGVSELKEDRKKKSPHNRLLVKSVVPNHTSDLKDELINLKEFPDDELPTNFIHNFFYNFDNLYPFVEKQQVLSSAKKIDFTQECIVDLQIYLIMSIGCLIHDSLNKDQVFDSYFNENIIESIIGIVNLNQRKCDEKSDFYNLSLLLLLTLYNVYRCDEEMTWNLVGILDRLMIKFDFYRHRQTSTEFDRLRQQMFWSVFTLDKELSLLTGKPSQLPSNELISVERLPGEVFNEFVDFAYIQQQANLLRLRENNDEEQLNSFSRLLDLWRVKVSRLVRADSNEFSINHLQEFTLLINLNYYYMSIELDQVSSHKSFQFTLQYISQMFSLAILNNDTRDKKPIALAMYSYFHLKRLVNVVKYNVQYFIALLDQPDLSLKFPEVTSNFQLMLNLVNFIKEKATYGPIKSLADSLPRLTTRVSSPDVIGKIQQQDAQTIADVKRLASELLGQV